MTVARPQGTAIRENPPGRQEHSMATTLAFDVYGTLIDTHGVVEKLEKKWSAIARGSFRRRGATSSSNILSDAA
jgi:hypothetical protein